MIDETPLVNAVTLVSMMMTIFRLLSATGAVWWLGLTGMKLF